MCLLIIIINKYYYVYCVPIIRIYCACISSDFQLTLFPEYVYKRQCKNPPMFCENDIVCFGAQSFCIPNLIR